jgi:hypothetical protein
MMTKQRSTNPSAIDWTQMMQKAQLADRSLSKEENDLWARGIIDGNAFMWNVQYVHALQKAIEANANDEFLAMARSEIPIPAFLLPAVAFLIQKDVSGKPAAFTIVQDVTVRAAFDKWVAHPDPNVPPSRREKTIRQQIARTLGVHEKTIWRSLKRTEKK